MRYEKTGQVSVAPERLWTVLSDVERWPQWIGTYQDVRLQQSGPLREGVTAYVKQRGLAGGTWTVTEWEEGSLFSWASNQPGVRLVGRHRVTPDLSRR